MGGTYQSTLEELISCQARPSVRVRKFAFSILISQSTRRGQFFATTIKLGYIDLDLNLMALLLEFLKATNNE